VRKGATLHIQPHHGGVLPWRIRKQWLATGRARISSSSWAERPKPSQ
jgi:hypothetical protein